MISLPDAPTGYLYEDAVTALIRARGYYTETRMKLDKDGRELLELDAVASPASENMTLKVLIDAKSGKTGFKDIFKIYGWRIFLDIPKGCVVRNSVPVVDENVFREYENELSVFVRKLSTDSFEEMDDLFPSLFNNDDETELELFTTGWYAGIAERLCIDDYNDFKKENKKESIVDNVKKYEKACMLSFFEKNPLVRVNQLYAAFRECPNISGKCVEYIAEKEDEDENEILKKVRDTNKYPWIQYVMMLEHRARLLIVKNAVESMDRYDDDDLISKFELYLTPLNFKKSFGKLRNNKNKYNIPYLLHIFFEILGGFYVEYEEYDDDIDFMSNISGIDKTEVVDCLKVIDDFFPTGSGWFISSKNEYHFAKHVPGIWKGIGCFARTTRCDMNYDEMCPRMGWLLSKYHNVAYNFLYPTLKAKNEVG